MAPALQPAKEGSSLDLSGEAITDNCRSSSTLAQVGHSGISPRRTSVEYSLPRAR
jgi:hypothetical protein